MLRLGVVDVLSANKARLVWDAVHEGSDGGTSNLGEAFLFTPSLMTADELCNQVWLWRTSADFRYDVVAKEVPAELIDIVPVVVRELVAAGATGDNVLTDTHSDAQRSEAFAFLEEKGFAKCKHRLEASRQWQFTLYGIENIQLSISVERQCNI